MADGMSAELDSREIADRHGQELLLVLVVCAVACRVERTRCAVEVALQQKNRCDAHGRAVRRGVALERTLEQALRQGEVACHERDSRRTCEVIGGGIGWNLR